MTDTDPDITAQLRAEALAEVHALDTEYIETAARVKANQDERNAARDELDEQDRADSKRVSEVASRVMAARDRLMRMKVAHITIERAKKVAP